MAKKKTEKPAAAGNGSNGYRPRLRARYLDEVTPKLRQEFGLDNPMGVPRVVKVNLNMGLGEAIQNIKLLDEAVDELAAIAGQRPMITRAHKSIANFKLREGMPIGCRVTLRGDRMHEFVDRLFTLAIPRIRDFRGIKRKSFDGRGNFSMGLADQLVFPEIDVDKVENPQGMDITFVMTGGSDAMSFELLSMLGMPFRKE